MQKCFRYLKGNCEKGKDCSFTHSKADPSKGDLEVQRRIAEKKAAAGVFLGGDRQEVMLAPVEELLQRPRIGSGTPAQALSSPVQQSLAREVSFAPPILSACGVVNSFESIVVEMAEIGDTVKAAVQPNTPNALSAGRRFAQQGFSFAWRPWEAKPEIWAPDGTPIECTTDEHFVSIIRRTKAPLKAAPVVESAAAGSVDVFRLAPLAITKELSGVVFPPTTSCPALDSLGRLAILQTAGNC